MTKKPAKTILAVGAHCGDIEVTCGAVLAKHSRMGDRVVILHLTLGEGGNPRMSPAEYGAQKRREAEAAAEIIGAEPLFGSYRDGELPGSEEVKRHVAGIVRTIKPTHIITHWRNSMHRDHATTHGVVNDALLLASLESVETGYPVHRGVQGVFYTENWEDPEGFRPYLYVDTTNEMELWKNAATQYQFIKGGISSFPYLDYYAALARVRGAEAGATYAVAFDVDSFAKKQTVQALP
jgi:LmbE family N-acetylglucosaminyl deacetylase